MGLYRPTSPVANVNPLKYKMETRYIKVAVIGKGHIFGEKDAISESNYSSTVR